MGAASISMSSKYVLVYSPGCICWRGGQQIELTLLPLSWSLHGPTYIIRIPCQLGFEFATALRLPEGVDLVDIEITHQRRQLSIVPDLAVSGLAVCRVIVVLRVLRRWREDGPATDGAQINIGVAVRSSSSKGCRVAAVLVCISGSRKRRRRTFGHAVQRPPVQIASVLNA